MNEIKEFHFNRGKIPYSAPSEEQMAESKQIWDQARRLEAYLEQIEADGILNQIKASQTYQIAGEAVSEYLKAIKMILDKREQHIDEMVSVAQSIWDYYQNKQ